MTLKYPWVFLGVTVLNFLNLFQVNAWLWDKKCPEVTAMKDIDNTRLTGTWYTLAKFNPTETDAVSCSKSVVSKMGAKSQTVDLKLSYLNNATNKYEKVEEKLKLEESQPGIYTYMQDYDVQGFFLTKSSQSLMTKSIIVYTDYEHVQLEYTCIEIPNYWGTVIRSTFFFDIKNRYFDSFKLAKTVLEKVKELKFDLNEIEFEYQGSNCTNTI